jgi:hypothetical protein
MTANPTAALRVALILGVAVGLLAGGVWGRAAVAGDGVHKVNQTLPFGEVNWDRGHIKVSAIGLPPFGASSAPAEVARQNAVNLAQKRLLGVILDFQVRDRKVREHLAGRPDLRERLRTVITSANVQGKSYSDGSVEITLTLPTSGSGSLSTLLGAL